jgi:GTPase SAR1 family protein
MNAPTGKPREVKAVLLGDTGVGKSSLVLRFVTNNFKPYSESTVSNCFRHDPPSIHFVAKVIITIYKFSLQHNIFFRSEHRS